MNKTVIASTLALIVGLVGGYFFGREHLKYEIRQAFSGAGEGLSKKLNVKNKKVVEGEKNRIKFGDRYRKDDLSLFLSSVEIGNPSVYSEFSQKLESGDPCLLIKFEIKNLSERKVVVFARNKFSSQINVFDDVGNVLKSLHDGIGESLVGAVKSYSDINPGSEITHVGAFSIPLPKTEGIVVSFDLECLGKEGIVEFEIPKSKIVQNESKAEHVTTKASLERAEIWSPRPEQLDAPTRPAAQLVQDGAPRPREPKKPTASTGEGSTLAPRVSSPAPVMQLEESDIKQQPSLLVGKGVKINTVRIQSPGAAALASGVTASPRIAATFNKKGEVIKAELLRSSGNLGWDRQVLSAVQRWTAEGEEVKKGGLVIRWTILLGAGGEE